MQVKRGMEEKIMKGRKRKHNTDGIRKKGRQGAVKGRIYDR